MIFVMIPTFFKLSPIFLRALLTVDNEYKINKLLERCTFWYIQCKKLMEKQLENTTAGFLDFSSLPKAYAGPESKAEMLKYKLTN